MDGAVAMTDAEFLNEMRRALAIILAALIRRYGQAAVVAFLESFLSKRGVILVQPERETLPTV